MASGPCLDDIAELVEAGKVSDPGPLGDLPSQPGQWELYRGRLGQCPHCLMCQIQVLGLGLCLRGNHSHRLLRLRKSVCHPGQPPGFIDERQAQRAYMLFSETFG